MKGFLALALCLCAAEENLYILISGMLKADGHLTGRFIKFLGILPIRKWMEGPVSTAQRED